VDVLALKHTQNMSLIQAFVTNNTNNMHNDYDDDDKNKK
jgi:hypothetical protein